MRDSTKEYIEFLKNIKHEVQQSRIKASLAVNKELIELYWDIGRQIVEMQEKGDSSIELKEIEELVNNLQNSFPSIKGFSKANISRMKKFYQLCQIIPRTVEEIKNNPIPLELLNIPWGHNIILMEYVEDPINILWYAQKTIDNGWGRMLLKDYIKSGLHKRRPANE